MAYRVSPATGSCEALAVELHCGHEVVVDGVPTWVDVRGRTEEVHGAVDLTRCISGGVRWITVVAVLYHHRLPCFVE